MKDLTDPAARATNALFGTVQGNVLQAATICGDVHIGTTAAPAPRPAPRQLPPTPRHFTDRTDTLAQLDRLLDNSAHGPAVAVVTGPPGVGKTAAAVRWLREQHDEFPDGQLFVDMRGHLPDNPMRPGEALPQLLRALGVTPKEIPATLDEQIASYRTMTADRRIAILCDNARCAAYVKPLIPASEHAVCLVTSRRQLTPLLTDGAQRVPLAPLDTDAAVDLLKQIAGTERIAAQAKAAKTFVKSAGGFPLTVTVAAALLLTRPTWSLPQTAAHLSALRPASPDAEVSMTACLDQSYTALPADAQRLYRRLGLHPGASFSRQIAHAVAATEPAVDADGGLAALVDANLLETPHPERYRIHDVIHQHAHQLANTHETPQQRHESIQRIVECYLRQTDTADRTLCPQRHRPPVQYTYQDTPDTTATSNDATATLGWLETERANLIAAQKLAAQAGLDTATEQLADALWGLFTHLRGHEDWIQVYERGVEAATRTGHRLVEARLRTGLGVALRESGQYEKALTQLDAALALRRECGDRRGEALVLQAMGVTHSTSGSWQPAHSALQDALTICEEIDDPRRQARIRASLGEVESHTGHHDTALAHLTQAHDELSRMQDPYAVMTGRMLGQAYIRADQPAAARAALHTAMQGKPSVDDFEAATIHQTLGELAEQENDNATASAFYVRAKAIFERLGACAAAERVSDRIRTLDQPPPR